MKKVFKKSLSLFLAVTIIFSSAIVGLGEVDFAGIKFENPFAIKAEAASESDLTFTLNYNGDSYSVTDCKTSAKGALVIPSMYKGKLVTSIEDYAFDSCAKLTSITIPCGVISIGDYAFYNCTSLTSIAIPDIVMSIGAYAFCNCTSLKSITIPDSVMYIGGCAFCNCTSLTSITIPDSVKYMGSYAFSYCTSLASITIPDGVTSIGNYAFYNCTSLTSITIPDSVTSIGDYAFYNCTSLASITIPDGVTSIGEYAFSYCTSLTSITIPDGVTSIGEYAFSYCTSLTSVTIGNSVTSMGNYAFSYCTSLTSVTIGNSVTSIGNYAFYECTSLASITIPDGVTSIGDEAFSYCTSLTSVTIGNSVTSIGNYAFYECTSLESVTIGDSVTSIGEGAFYECTSLTSVTIPNSVTSIGESAFEVCKSLTSVTIGNSVTSIGNFAFYSCRSLTSVTIPDSVTNIGNYAFCECTSLESVTIGDSVTNIGEGAFKICTSLESVTIGDSVTSIGESAFYECTSLESVTIGDSVTNVGDSAFFLCESIKYVFFKGTQDEWATISIGWWNSSLTGAKIHYEATDHTVSEWIWGSEATCTTAGSKHKECTVCEVVLKTEAIPAKGHTEVKDAAVAATCTTAGKTEGKHCSVCNAVIVAQQTIPAKGHTEVKDVAVAATCTTAGKTEGKHCSVCNAIIVAQQTIPAKGHTTSELKYNAEKRLEYKECTVCKVVLQLRYIPLNVPTITSCYNEVKGVQLKWNAVADAVKYEIYRKLPTESGWTKITTVSALAYQDTDVVSDTVYQYRIKAVDQYGNESDYSAQRECRFIATPTLKTRESAVGGVKITWEKVAGATSYRIYRRGAGTDYWYYLGDVSASENTFFDKESSLVTSGNYYRYTVRASYDGKDSSGKDYLIYSGFDTNGLYLKYVATPKLTIISNATNGLQIKWNAVNGGGRVEYRVYRRGAGSTYWKYLGTTTSTTWTDSEVKNANGGYYRYTVRAVQGTNGKGWYSAFDTNGLFLMRLANPTLKSAVSSSSGITVKWGSVKGATSYYVYRKTANSGWTRVAVVNGNANTTYLDKTAKKGTTYAYTVRAVFGKTTSYFNSGISCKDKY